MVKERPHKLAHYRALCEIELELEPDSARPYFNIGLYYTDLGPEHEDYKKGVQMMMKACDLAPNFYMARQELGMHHCRMALRKFLVMNEIIGDHHPLKSKVKNWLKTLNEICQEIRSDG